MYFIKMDDNDWYGGKTYIYQGGLYPVRTKREEAKSYKSKKVAENTIERLKQKCDGDFYLVDESE